MKMIELLLNGGDWVVNTNSKNEAGYFDKFEIHTLKFDSLIYSRD